MKDWSWKTIRSIGIGKIANSNYPSNYLTHPHRVRVGQGIQKVSTYYSVSSLLLLISQTNYEPSTILPVSRTISENSITRQTKDFKLNSFKFTADETMGEVQHQFWEVKMDFKTRNT